MARVRIDVDRTAGAAYMTLDNDREIATTVEVSDLINVDLDEYGVVVGIEILTLSNAGLSLPELRQDFHIHRDAWLVIEAHLNEMMSFITGTRTTASVAGAAVPPVAAGSLQIA